MSEKPGFVLFWMDDDGKERSHQLRPGESVVGRLSREDPWGVYLKDVESLVKMGVEDPTVSRIHAVFLLNDEGLQVEDRGTRGKGSRNGTFVNGKRLEPRKPVKIEPGDEVRLGRYTVFKVGRMEDKPTIPVKPGETILLDTSRVQTLPQELLRQSIQITPRKIALVIDEKTPRKSLDLGDIKIRPEYKSDTYREYPVQKLKNLLSNIDSKLADGLRYVEKGLNRRDTETLKEGALIIIAYLKPKTIAGIELAKEFERMGLTEDIESILAICENITKDRAEEPQIKNLITFVRKVQHTIRATIDML